MSKRRQESRPDERAPKRPHPGIVQAEDFESTVRVVGGSKVALLVAPDAAGATTGDYLQPGELAEVEARWISPMDGRIYLLTCGQAGWLCTRSRKDIDKIVIAAVHGCRALDGPAALPVGLAGADEKHGVQTALDASGKVNVETLLPLTRRLLSTLPSGSSARRSVIQRLALVVAGDLGGPSEPGSGLMPPIKEFNEHVLRLVQLCVLRRSRARDLQVRERQAQKAAQKKAVEREALGIDPAEELVEAHLEAAEAELTFDVSMEEVRKICATVEEQRPFLKDGSLVVENMQWFVSAMLNVSCMRSHWIEAWQQLFSRMSNALRGAVVETLIVCLMEFMVEDRPFKVFEVADVMAHLTRAELLSIRALERPLTSFIVMVDSAASEQQEARSDDDLPAWWVMSRLLANWFPQPAGVGWGWSKADWTWEDWWQLAQRLLNRLPPARGFDVLTSAVQSMESLDGRPTCEQEVWQEVRLVKLRHRLCALASTAEGRQVEEVELPLRMSLGPSLWRMTPAAPVGWPHRGCRVRLRDLRSEVTMNGALGACLSQQAQDGRWIIFLDMGGRVTARTENLEAE
eukprot:TRINITY_DN25308_c0_g1_i1.p1 TRINITY_DN25308_c0_g1~~TRINITY_DN25308_c0_g1_i1.p1  ORF type:complete len:574 (-),score=122.91 TRINITY_DN25308_c0_g1_i1:105-1826(-)